ncbi:glycosyltransferase family 4 protein [Magnetofaba australis]|uniref:glycosyltransferase family 4 protein n=1 Tax=Magnetofaba australis TaxID=1472297 RepID=UPI000A19ED98|nr:glycosyltransferase family 1 protein [Magnetofaba australis]
MRIVIVSDAWRPQRNGVIRVLESLIESLHKQKHDVIMITPLDFKTTPCPTYPEIPLSLFPYRKLSRLMSDAQADAYHIATEGPLGWAARKWCVKNSVPFTTAYHTKFPEYVHARTKLPLDWLYAGIRFFHKHSHVVMAPSPSVFRELSAKGFDNVKPWAHGVNSDVFRPYPKEYLDLPRPVHMYVGRIAIEKNLTAFLDLELDGGSKVIVGRGPQRDELEAKYPQAHFFDTNTDETLARLFSSADVFVFPSLTDTFGLVVLEALSCGVPVAAYPVTGPLDVLQQKGPMAGPLGALNADLKLAIQQALISGDPEACREYALQYSWERVSQQFLSFLAVAPDQAQRDSSDSEPLLSTQE